MTEIREAFGQGLADEDVVDWLCKVFTLLGTADHGAISNHAPRQDGNHIFSKATHAAECAANLILVKE